jgi:hypothetical protein
MMKVSCVLAGLLALASTSWAAPACETVVLVGSWSIQWLA